MDIESLKVWQQQREIAMGLSNMAGNSYGSARNQMNSEQLCSQQAAAQPPTEPDPVLLLLGDDE